MFAKRIAFALAGLALTTTVTADYSAGFVAYDAGEYKTAMNELQPEAEQGDAWAQFIVGRMYANGYGATKDAAMAVHWYNQAAEQGHELAQFNLADMYDFGHGVPEDDARAAYWYQKLAMQGIAAAQYSLGVLYARGEGVPEDLVRGYAWVNLAAAQGNEKAKGSEGIAKERMTHEQIAEGQKLSSELYAQINGESP